MFAILSLGTPRTSENTTGPFSFPTVFREAFALCGRSSQSLVRKRSFRGPSGTLGVPLGERVISPRTGSPRLATTHRQPDNHHYPLAIDGAAHATTRHRSAAVSHLDPVV